MDKIEVNLSQEKLHLINDTYLEELQYWKKVALDNFPTENERKQLTDLAPPQVFLTGKAAIKNSKKKEIYENILYLKSWYSSHNREQRTFIQDIPKQEYVSSFKAISENLKTSKSIKEDKNMVLKNIYLVGGYQ